MCVAKIEALPLHQQLKDSEQVASIVRNHLLEPMAEQFYDATFAKAYPLLSKCSQRRYQLTYNRAFRKGKRAVRRLQRETALGMAVFTQFGNYTVSGRAVRDIEYNKQYGPVRQKKTRDSDWLGVDRHGDLVVRRTEGTPRVPKRKRHVFPLAVCVAILF